MPISTWTSQAPRRPVSRRPSTDGRLFTLSQGQLEVKFPPGFGIPVLSNEPLDLITQVLNLNFDDQQFRVRHRVTLDFVRDRDVPRPMRPLYQGGVYGLKALSDKEMAYDAAESLLLGDAKCSSCCLPGKKAVESAEGIDRASAADLPATGSSSRDAR